MALTPQEIDRRSGVRYNEFDPTEPFWKFVQLGSPLGRYLLTTEGPDRRFREKIEDRKRLLEWLKVEKRLGIVNEALLAEEADLQRRIELWPESPEPLAVPWFKKQWRSVFEKSPLGDEKAQKAATASGDPNSGKDSAFVSQIDFSGGPAVGQSPDGGDGDDGGGPTNLPTDGADPTYNGSEDGVDWASVPKDGELWDIEGQKVLAYQSEVGGPWVYYTIPDEDALQRIFPTGMPPARTLTQEEADRFGAINPGSINLLSLDLGQNWEEGFNALIERESLTSPWLKDGEVVATLLAVTLEGRELTDADLESTEYFRSRSDAEIQYVSFAATATPDELKQYHANFNEQVRQGLHKAGVRAPDPTVVDFMAQKWASGQWTPEYLSQQIMTVSNPMSSLEMDDDLAQLTSGVEFDTLRGQTEEIKTLVKQWLGPMHGGSYSDEWFQQWAGSIMDDPNAQNDLIDYLQGQRLALYPEYENPNLRYADIAPVWENQMLQQWGIQASNSQQWGTLDRIIRANDSAAAGKILREEGINQGIEQVERRVMQGFSDNVGDQVVRSF